MLIVTQEKATDPCPSSCRFCPYCHNFIPFLASASFPSRFAKLRILRSSHLVMVHSTSPVERNLQEHMRGWNHLRRLDSLKVAEKSVFIRGFPGDVTQAALRSFFEEQVGSVNWVWLNEDVSGCGQYNEGLTPCSPYADYICLGRVP